MINKQKFLEELDEFLKNRLHEETVSGVGPTAASISMSSNVNSNPQIQKAITGAQQILQNTQKNDQIEINQNKKNDQKEEQQEKINQQKRNEALKKISDQLNVIQNLNKPNTNIQPPASQISQAPQGQTGLNIPKNMFGV